MVTHCHPIRSTSRCMCVCMYASKSKTACGITRSIQQQRRRSLAIIESMHRNKQSHAVSEPMGTVAPSGTVSDWIGGAVYVRIVFFCRCLNCGCVTHEQFCLRAAMQQPAASVAAAATTAATTPAEWHRGTAKTKFLNETVWSTYKTVATPSTKHIRALNLVL